MPSLPAPSLLCDLPHILCPPPVSQVVEGESTAAQQTEALRLLFALIAYSPRYEQDFLHIDGYGMLVKVFLTQNCIIGYELLMVCSLQSGL